MHRQCKVLGWRACAARGAWKHGGQCGTSVGWQLRIVVAWQRALAVRGWPARRTVGEPGMPLHDKWLGPSALGRSASIRAGIVWASLWASFKDYMLSAFPSTSKNLAGQEFHGTAYHDPEDKTSRYNKLKAMGTVGQSSANHAGPAIEARLSKDQCKRCSLPLHAALFFLATPSF